MNATSHAMHTAPDWSLLLPDAESTRRAGAAFARLCHAGDCLTLSGPLGAGKTTFAQGFVQALAGARTEVTSPTFTLVQAYEANGIPLLHADLYRLESESEFPALGLEENFESGITLIEWPQIACRFLPAGSLHLFFHLRPDGARLLTAPAHPRLEKISL